MKFRKATATAALAIATLLLAACSVGDRQNAEALTSAQTTTPQRTSTVVAPESPTPVELTPYEGATAPITGLFIEPFEAEADIYRSIDPIPPSQFSEWDGKSVVLYNLDTGEEINLGEGSIFTSAFSPDGTKFAWNSGRSTAGGFLASEAGEIWVLDLETMERRSYGTGGQVSFADDYTLVVSYFQSQVQVFIDLDFGQEQSVESPNDSFGSGRLFHRYTYGYVLEILFEDRRITTAARYTLIPDDTSPALQFTASSARLVSAGQMVVVTIPLDAAANVFLVDTASGEATFVATAFSDQPNTSPRISVVLSEPEGVVTHIAWNNYGCDPERGRARIYDLRTGTLTELDRALPLSGAIDAGGIILGYPGLRLATLDPDTLEYRDVMPGNGAGAVGSAEGRWAANGPSIFSMLAGTPCGGPLR